MADLVSVEAARWAAAAAAAAVSAAFKMYLDVRDLRRDLKDALDKLASLQTRVGVVEEKLADMLQEVTKTSAICEARGHRPPKRPPAGD